MPDQTLGNSFPVARDGTAAERQADPENVLHPSTSNLSQPNGSTRLQSNDGS
jgi:hypothetical protein